MRGSEVLLGSAVSLLSSLLLLSLDATAAVVVDDEDDGCFFFLRFLSMPAFLAPLSFRPPPVDV